MARKFNGEIKVASRIVDYLSSGLYNSPAACIKELVNNSYDADATIVEIFVKPDADRIVIADNGVGMSEGEFKRHFERVSESHKRDDGDRTSAGRPKIGKIGIGFIAANELCDVMEIISTKKGSTELLKVQVNFDEMRRDPSERKRKNDAYVKGDYTGTVEAAPRNQHYTHVLLKQVKPVAKGFLDGALRREHIAGKTSVYGLTPKEVCELISADPITNWGDLDEYSTTILQVALNVPVRYLPDWYPKRHGRVLRRFDREVDELDFNVFCDGSDLRKPVVLPSDGLSLIRPLNIDGQHVSARGYLFIKHRVLRPEWLNGVLIRIRNAAVGDYDRSFLGFKSSEQTLYQRWASCEVWADDRLEEALNIDRRTLRITHPAYVELQEAFHDQLSDFLREARHKLHSEPTAERRRQEARHEVQRLAEVIARPQTALPAEMRRELRSVVRHRVSAERISAPRDVRSALRKYTVAEMYELALEVAQESLSRKQYELFARALAERLLR